jgi:hypothetical protein
VSLSADARQTVRHYEVRVHGRMSHALTAALVPVTARHEASTTVLEGALDQRQLYDLLEHLLADLALVVLDVRVVGAAACASVIIAPKPGPAPAVHELQFAGSIAAEQLRVEGAGARQVPCPQLEVDDGIRDRAGHLFL